jgi:hypothetical protein
MAHNRDIVLGRSRNSVELYLFDTTDAWYKAFVNLTLPLLDEPYIARVTKLSFLPLDRLAAAIQEKHTGIVAKSNYGVGLPFFGLTVDASVDLESLTRDLKEPRLYVLPVNAPLIVPIHRFWLDVYADAISDVLVERNLRVSARGTQETVATTDPYFPRFREH